MLRQRAVCAERQGQLPFSEDLCAKHDSLTLLARKRAARAMLSCLCCLVGKIVSLHKAYREPSMQLVAIQRMRTSSGLQIDRQTEQTIADLTAAMQAAEADLRITKSTLGISSLQDCCSLLSLLSHLLAELVGQFLSHGPLTHLVCVSVSLIA